MNRLAEKRKIEPNYVMFRTSGAMGSSKANPQITQSETGADDRLESWKEIAVHLKRGLTTVQRWEAQEGLPVYRHVHNKQGTVYAYKSEIDAWWQQRSSLLNGENGQEVLAGRRSRLRYPAVAAAVALLVLLAGLGMWLAQPPPLPFEERDWVLIAEFENRTGEEVFNGTVEYALERELSNSRFVNVVPRVRINDTLRLMKRPPDTSIIPELAREVALRDGGIRALITGRVEKHGSTYALSTALVNPADGVTVAGFYEEAEGEKGVLPAMRRLSGEMRRSLGEKLSTIQESEQKLEKVTTPSLRALQLFSQGSVLKENGQFSQAEEFLRRAVAEDPDFASAHLWLCFALSNQGKPKQEYISHLEAALKLSDFVTEHERYFIRGSYYLLRGEPEKSIAPYKNLLRIYPDHYFGTTNLASAYRQLGRAEDAITLLQLMADWRSRSPSWNFMMASSIAQSSDDPTLADRYAERLRTSLSENSKVGWKASWAHSWARLLPVYHDWKAGRIQLAQNEADRIARTMQTMRGDALAVLCQFHLTLGQLKAAEYLDRRYHIAARRRIFLAEAEFARGDLQALREIYSSDMTKRPMDGTGNLPLVHLVRAGFAAEVKEALSHNKTELLPREYRLVTLGELALASGDLVGAKKLLEEGTTNILPRYGWTFFLGRESLARILEQAGDLPGAIATLEEASRKRQHQLYTGNSMLYWTRIEAQLADLYRKVGRVEEARAIENELRHLLQFADEDHAVLRQLAEVERADASRAGSD